MDQTLSRECQQIVLNVILQSRPTFGKKQRILRDARVDFPHVMCIIEQQLMIGINNE